MAKQQCRTQACKVVGSIPSAENYPAPLVDILRQIRIRFTLLHLTSSYFEMNFPFISLGYPVYNMPVCMHCYGISTGKWLFPISMDIKLLQQRSKDGVCNLCKLLFAILIRFLDSKSALIDNWSTILFEQRVSEDTGPLRMELVAHYKRSVKLQAYVLSGQFLIFQQDVPIYIYIY